MARITFTCSMLFLFFNQVMCQPSGQSTDNIPRTGIVTAMLDMKLGKEMYNAMQFKGEVKVDGKTYVRTVTPAGRTERDLDLGDGTYLALINLLCVQNNLNDCFDFLVVTSMGFASFGEFVAAAKLVRLADDDDLYQGVFVLNGMVEFAMKNGQCVVVDGKTKTNSKTYDCSKKNFRPYTKVAPPLSPPPSSSQYNTPSSTQLGSSPPTKYPLGYTGAHPASNTYPLSNGVRTANPPGAISPGYGSKSTSALPPSSNQLGSSPPTKYPLGYTGTNPAADTYPLSNGVRSATAPAANRAGYGTNMPPPPPSTFALPNGVQQASKPTGIRTSTSPSSSIKPLGYTGEKPAASAYPPRNSDYAYQNDGEIPEDVYNMYMK